MVYTKGRGIGKQEKLTKLSFFPFLGASFFLLFGQVQYASFSMKFFSVCMVLLWFLVALLEHPRAFENAVNNKYTLLIFFSMLLRLAVLLISPYGFSNSVEYILARLSMYMPMFAFTYYQQFLTMRQFKFITYSVLTIWIAVIISILSYLNFDIDLARQLSAGTANGYGFFGSLIDVSIGTGCIALALFGLRKRVTEPKMQKCFKTLFVVFLILFLVDGYYTQSFIAFFIVLIMMLMEWMLPNGGAISRRQVLMTVLILLSVLVLMILRGNIGDVFLSTAHIFDGSIFEEKFIEIGTSLKGGEAVGDVGVRLNHLTTSIQTVLRNPAFGTAPELGYSLDHSVVGRHSGLDLFARFGLVGALPAVWGYWGHLKGCAKLSHGFMTNSWTMLIIMNGAVLL